MAWRYLSGGVTKNQTVRQSTHATPRSPHTAGSRAVSCVKERARWYNTRDRLDVGFCCCRYPERSLFCSSFQKNKQNKRNCQTSFSANARRGPEATQGRARPGDQSTPRDHIFYTLTWDARVEQELTPYTPTDDRCLL